MDLRSVSFEAHIDTVHGIVNNNQLGFNRQRRNVYLSLTLSVFLLLIAVSSPFYLHVDEFNFESNIVALFLYRVLCAEAITPLAQIFEKT